MHPTSRACAFAVALMLVTAQVLDAQPGAGFTVNAGGVTPSHNPITVTSQTRLTITCAPPVDCTGLRVVVQGADGKSQVAGVTGGTAPGTLQVSVSPQMLGGGQGSLLVSGTGTAGGTIALVQGAPVVPPVPAPAPAVQTVSLADKVDVGALLTRDCNALASYRGSLYDARNDTAIFIVTPVGNVLARPGDVIDENDVIVVHVVGDTQIVPRLAVTRISDFRTPGQVSFLGEGESIADLIKAARDSLAPPPPCVRRRFLITDLAPGKKGEIQLALVNEKGERSEVGKFDFGVHTLYSGAFSFGPIRTELRDPEIGTVTRSGKEIVTATENGTPRVLYVLSFTPFMWGRRELEEPGPWYTHINPTIGIVPAHVQDNAMLGLSIDVLNSFYLQGGVHAGRVRRLDTRSGIELGDEFTGTGNVPTVKEWDADWFVGLTVDLRAAVEFLKIAATGAGGG